MGGEPCGTWLLPAPDPRAPRTKAAFLTFLNSIRPAATWPFALTLWAWSNCPWGQLHLSPACFYPEYFLESILCTYGFPNHLPIVIGGSHEGRDLSTFSAPPALGRVSGSRVGPAAG